MAEYVSTNAEFVALKPKNLTHIQAASLPLVSLTTMQSFSRYTQEWAGKTVFIPGGCKCFSPTTVIRFNVLKIFLVSGTGSIACQLAKNILGASKVITTVSTKKVPKVDELLGAGVVDQSKYGEIPH